MYVLLSRLNQWLSELGLNPNPVHFQHFATVHLQPTIDHVLLLPQAGRLKQPRHLIGRKEVHTRAVAAHIEVILQTLARLEAQLRQIVATVVAEQQNAAGFQVLVHLVGDVLHSGDQVEDQCTVKNV